jgi:hypothetical protein
MCGIKVKWVSTLKKNKCVSVIPREHPSPTVAVVSRTLMPFQRHRTLCLSLGATLHSSATTDTFHGHLVDDGLCFCSGPPRRSASGKRIGNGDDGDDDDDDDDAVMMMGVIVMMRNE